MIGKRLFFGTILIAALGGLLFADHQFSGPLQLGTHVIRYEGALVALVLAVLSVAGTLEMCKLAEAAGHAPLKLWSAFTNYLLVLIPYLLHNGLIGGGELDLASMMIVGLLAAFLGSCLLIGARRKTDHAIADLGVTLLIIFYLGLLPTFLLRLRLEASVPLLLYFIIVTKSCDIGAFFTGKFLGRNKLIEWLSPKKTIEGLLGGVAFSILVAIGLSHWSAICIHGDDGSPISIPTATAVIFGLVMAVVGQAGDLLESLFKRDAKIKDSGSLIPEFGGVLDLIDSLLPTAPLAYLILLR